MTRYLITIILLSLTLFADSQTLLAKKGAKMAALYCDQARLETINDTSAKEIQKTIQSQNLCPDLSDRQLKAVTAYLIHKQHTTDQNTPDKINVPQKAKCPVCGMFVAKYPKWVAYMQDTKGNKLYFDGVKDMMKYYFNHPDETFDPILVSDFYTLRPIDGKKAWYVIGSNVYGPMGEELIPFKTRQDAQTFLKEHFGKQIITFDQIRESYLY